MTDLELARQWICKTFAHAMDFDADEVLALAALLVRIRLEEAELFLANHKKKSWTGQHMMKLRRQAGIKHLEQAAGGSAAAGRQK